MESPDLPAWRRHCREGISIRHTAEPPSCVIGDGLALGVEKTREGAVYQGPY